MYLIPDSHRPGKRWWFSSAREGEKKLEKGGKNTDGGREGKRNESLENPQGRRGHVKGKHRGLFMLSRKRKGKSGGRNRRLLIQLPARRKGPGKGRGEKKKRGRSVRKQGLHSGGFATSRRKRERKGKAGYRNSRLRRNGEGGGGEKRVKGREYPHSWLALRGGKKERTTPFTASGGGGGRRTTT